MKIIIIVVLASIGIALLGFLVLTVYNSHEYLNTPLKVLIYSFGLIALSVLAWLFYHLIKISKEN